MAAFVVFMRAWKSIRKKNYLDCYFSAYPHYEDGFRPKSINFH